MNIGYSSRLPYDDCYYQTRLKQSTDPLNYKVNVDYMNNCNRCLSTLGPRSSHMGYGVSTAKKVGVAPALELTDVDSVLSNRNVKKSSCFNGHINPVNPTQWKATDSAECDNFLNPERSRLSYPARTYRSMNINRFYNLPLDAQKPIFYDFASHTRLEAKDNYMPNLPEDWGSGGVPVENRTPPYNMCGGMCGGKCGKFCGKK
jgi:hypothetical protein